MFDEEKLILVKSMLFFQNPFLKSRTVKHRMWLLKAGWLSTAWLDGDSPVAAWITEDRR